MPKLSFQDVFLEDKEAVLERVREDERQVYAMSIVITDIMMRTNTRSITVRREDFMKRLQENNVSEPVGLSFKGNGDSVTVRLDGDNGNSNTWK